MVWIVLVVFKDRETLLLGQLYVNYIGITCYVI